jgi:hypothetical protein
LRTGWTARQADSSGSGEEEDEALFESLLAELERIDAFQLEPKSRKDYLHTCADYEAFSRSVRRNQEPWPISGPMVRLFLVYKFFKNNMSAKSLGAYKTHLKWYQQLHDHEWFEGTALRRITVTHRALSKIATPESKVVRRKTPLTIARLSLVMAQLLPHENLSHLELVTLCWLCHNGLLRGGEAVKLLIGDVIWSGDRHSLRLKIRDSKCNKTGPPEFVDLTDWGNASSAVGWMRDYYDKNNLWNADSKDPLFPSYTVKSTFVTAVQRLVRLVRLDGDFAGHSFRSGGASDLWAANVPLEAIKKIGRWKSDAVLLYLRDGAVTAQKIAMAFKFCSTNHEFMFWGVTADGC